jgi:hypothetical protein
LIKAIASEMDPDGAGRGSRDYMRQSFPTPICLISIMPACQEARLWEPAVSTRTGSSPEQQY